MAIGQKAKSVTQDRDVARQVARQANDVEVAAGETAMRASALASAKLQQPTRAGQDPSKMLPEAPDGRNTQEANRNKEQASQEYVKVKGDSQKL